MSEEEDGAAITDAQVLDEILDTLDLVMERVEKLEKKIDGLKGGGGGPDAFVADQLEEIGRKLDALGSAPAGGAARPARASAPADAGETLDDIARDVKAIFGATVRRRDEETEAGPLEAKLADPAVTAGLARILDRLDALESTARSLESVARRAPILIEGAGAVVDKTMNDLEARGIDVFDRGERGLAVLEKASRPENLDLVGELLDHGDTLRFAAATGGKVAGAVADKEAFGDGLAKLTAKGGAVLASPALDKLLDSALLDPEKLDASVDALTRLLEVATRPEVQKLLDSGLLDAAALGTVETAGTALVEARKAPIESVGMFGVLGKLGDADVKKATGFLFAVLKRFGSRL